MACMFLLAAGAGYLLPRAALMTPLRPLRGRSVLNLESVPEDTVETTQDTRRGNVLEGTLFTLQDRDDGWNDVRSVVNNTKKDRAKAWNELSDWAGRANAKISPATRWVSVIGGEVLEATGAVSKVSELGSKLATVASSANEGDIKAAALDFLTAAARKREAEQKAKEEAKAKALAEEEARARAAARRLSVVGAFNVALLIGIPASTLGLLAYLATTASN